MAYIVQNIDEKTTEVWIDEDTFVAGWEFQDIPDAMYTVINRMLTTTFQRGVDIGADKKAQEIKTALGIK